MTPDQFAEILDSLRAGVALRPALAAALHMSEGRAHAAFAREATPAQEAEAQAAISIH